MCKECNIIKVIFNSTQENARDNYLPILSFLDALEKQNRIEMFAGDCLLNEAVEVLCAEKHYTVCHYLRCKQCGQIFFFGACIRGTPIYKLVDDIENENLSNMIWGNIGTKYSNHSR